MILVEVAKWNLVENIKEAISQQIKAQIPHSMLTTEKEMNVNIVLCLSIHLIKITIVKIYNSYYDTEN